MRLIENQLTNERTLLENSNLTNAGLQLTIDALNQKLINKEIELENYNSILDAQASEIENLIKVIRSTEGSEFHKLKSKIDMLTAKVNTCNLDLEKERDTNNSLRIDLEQALQLLPPSHKTPDDSIQWPTGKSVGFENDKEKISVGCSTTELEGFEVGVGVGVRVGMPTSQEFVIAELRQSLVHEKEQVAKYKGISENMSETIDKYVDGRMAKVSKELAEHKTASLAYYKEMNELGVKIEGLSA
jgi:hypothetical protein